MSNMKARIVSTNNYVEILYEVIETISDFVVHTIAYALS